MDFIWVFIFLLKINLMHQQICLLDFMHHSLLVLLVNKIIIYLIPQFTAGFIAGTITSACVNPLDVVKTRIQTQNINTLGTTSSTIMYKNIFHGLQCLWREEGIHGLMRGVLPKLMSRGPLSA